MLPSALFPAQQTVRSGPQAQASLLDLNSSGAHLPQADKLRVRRPPCPRYSRASPACFLAATPWRCSFSNRPGAPPTRGRSIRCGRYPEGSSRGPSLPGLGCFRDVTSSIRLSSVTLPKLQPRPLHCLIFLLSTHTSSAGGTSCRRLVSLPLALGVCDGWSCSQVPSAVSAAKAGDPQILVE